MKRILKTRTFNRWLRKTLLTDAALLKAIDEMEQGLVDADLAAISTKNGWPCRGEEKAGAPGR